MANDFEEIIDEQYAELREERCCLMSLLTRALPFVDTNPDAFRIGGDELNQEIIAVLQAKKWECNWKEDDDGIFDTRCGNRHEFITGGPRDNHHDFCPYCGCKIYVVAPSSQGLLPAPSPLRTARAGFPASSSSPSKAALATR